MNEYYSDSVGTYAAPVMKKDEVKGFVGHASTAPDRWIYVLDPSDDRIWEWDAYKRIDPETKKPYWEVLLICPKCRDNLRLDSRLKQIHIDEAHGVETGEPFFCGNVLERDGFTGRCDWGCELKPHDGEPVPMTDNKNGRPGMCKIDAVFVPARR